MLYFDCSGRRVEEAEAPKSERKEVERSMFFLGFSMVCLGIPMIFSSVFYVFSIPFCMVFLGFSRVFFSVVFEDLKKVLSFFIVSKKTPALRT